MDYKKYKLADSIGYQITATARLVINRLNDNFKQNNLPMTHDQWSIMIRLWEEDGLPQSKLSKLTGKDQPSITRLVNNLIKNDLVRRVKHPIDARTNLIFLTTKGKKMQISMIEQAQKTIKDIQEGIGPEELECFSNVLSKIQRNLSK